MTAGLLDAAQRLLLDEGLEGLTPERVTAALGAEPGAPQPAWSRQQLLDALFEHLLMRVAADYKSALAREPAGPARHVWAYLRSALTREPQARQRARTMAVLVNGDARMRAEWAEFADHAGHADTLDADTQRACLRIADGALQTLALGGEPDPEAAVAAFARVLRAA